MRAAHRRDWILLLTNLAALTWALVELPRQPGVAIPALVLFGAGASFVLFSLFRSRRIALARSSPLDFAGDGRIRKAKSHSVTVGLLTMAAGALFLVPGAPIFFTAAGSLLLLAGGAIVLGVATGRLPVGSLEFRSEGLAIEDREGIYVLPWDAIVGAEAGEHRYSPVVLVTLRSPDDVIARAPMTREGIVALTSRNVRWFGAHVVIMTAPYRVDAAALAAAVQRYSTSPESRLSLGAASAEV